MTNWLEIIEKNNYSKTYNVSGIVFLVENKEDIMFTDELNEVKEYLKYYLFPLRLYVYFTDNEKYISKKDSHIYYSCFLDRFDNDKPQLPIIYIAARKSNNNTTHQILYNLFYMISCYYQWLFGMDKKRKRILYIVNQMIWLIIIYMTTI